MLQLLCALHFLMVLTCAMDDIMDSDFKYETGFSATPRSSEGLGGDSNTVQSLQPAQGSAASVIFSRILYVKFLENFIYSELKKIGRM